jgi:hypothetical protein
VGVVVQLSAQSLATPDRLAHVTAALANARILAAVSE